MDIVIMKVPQVLSVLIGVVRGTSGDLTFDVMGPIAGWINS
jgi:hypothetical protein